MSESPAIAEMVALGVVELTSIARGIVVADAAVKRAPSLLIRSQSVSSGKHLVMMRGGVAEVEESMLAAIEAAAEYLLDSLELPYMHDRLWPYVARPMDRPVRVESWPAATGEPAAESVAIVEVATVCGGIGSADCALKTAPVTIRDLHLAVGIGGKAVYTMTGELADVQACAEAAAAYAGTRLVAVEVIAAPAGELRGRLFF